MSGRFLSLLLLSCTWIQLHLAGFLLLGAGLMTLCYYCCFNAMESKKNPNPLWYCRQYCGLLWVTVAQGGGTEAKNSLFHIIFNQSPQWVLWGWELGGRSGGSVRKENVSYGCDKPLYSTPVVVWELDANINRNGRKKQILGVSGRLSSFTVEWQDSGNRS